MHELCLCFYLFVFLIACISTHNKESRGKGFPVSKKFISKWLFSKFFEKKIFWWVEYKLKVDEMSFQFWVSKISLKSIRISNSVIPWILFLWDNWQFNLVFPQQINHLQIYLISIYNICENRFWLCYW